ncbi:pimeloyl-ACP methyl ester carboxylesterase [Nakamurella sp. UYEF19]|uniref:alpha/beta fold hydrolase n=1 Tax=Nakamurella sp. UYEF19 TaxID=1756392 RepID=UPI00339259E2
MITARDDLESWTTAELAEVGGETPGVADDPPAGWTEMVDGRGVFLRRTDKPIDAGPDGPDVWFVHGLAGSSTNWVSLAGALADRAVGYLVDLPGHGRSDPPPRGRYSLVDDAWVVAQLIRRYSSGPVHLVGNSMGGIVVTALAARFPELVATLTLISPAVPDLRLTKDRGADRILGLLLLPGTAGVAVRQLSATSPMARARGMGRLCYGDPSRLTDHDFEVAAADLAWRGPLPWVHLATIGTLRALMRSYLRRSGSFQGDAARIRVPTLVIWGTRDALVDVRLSRRTAEAFPDASLLVIAGAGHTAQMEEPRLTARAIARLWEKPGAPHLPLTGPVATSSA